MGHIELQRSLHQARRKMRLAKRRVVKTQLVRRQFEVTAKQPSQQPAANQIAPAVVVESEPAHSLLLVRGQALFQARDRTGRPVESRPPDVHLALRPSRTIWWRIPT